MKEEVWKKTRGVVMKKKVSVLFMSILFLFSFSILSFAAQRQNLIQSVWIDGETLSMICAGVEENDGEYTASLGGQTLPLSTSHIGEEGLPVTVFCLVDTSGSINDYKMNLLQDTLFEISASMGEGDSMVIATIDNQLNIGEVMLTVEERSSAIESISSSHKDTNLYAGIVKSLERLTSDESYNPYKCLVILSDGNDCQDNGMTEQEVLTAIERSHLPVYTVALMVKSSELEGGKIIGSFSRSSFGGLHLTTAAEGGEKPLRTDVTGAEFGSAIWNSLQNMVVLKADLTDMEIDHSESEILLSVNLSSGSIVYTDSIGIDSGELPYHSDESDNPDSTDDPDPTDSPEPTDNPNPADSPEPTEIPDDTTSFVVQYWWIILIAAVVAVCILIVIFIILRKRSGRHVEDMPPTNAVDQTIPEPAGLSVSPEPVVKEEDYHPEKTFSVKMTDIPHGTHRLLFVIPAYQAVTFGRDGRSQNVIDADDRKLSGVHFALIAQDGHYCIRDENSTNGTMVNGVSIAKMSWFKLQSGDKVRVGSYEYRIIIEPSELT